MILGASVKDGGLALRLDADGPYAEAEIAPAALGPGLDAALAVVFVVNEMLRVIEQKRRELVFGP